MSYRTENKVSLEEFFDKDEIKEINKYSNHLKYNHNIWLRKVISRTNTKIQFSHICKLVESNGSNIKDIYDDYQDMCRYAHGTDLYIKLMGFTFYNSYFNIIDIMFKYMSNGFMNLMEDGESNQGLLEKISRFDDLMAQLEISFFIR